MNEAGGGNIFLWYQLDACFLDQDLAHLQRHSIRALLFYFLLVHLDGTKSKEELFNDVYGQIQNKIEELLNTQVYIHAYNCNSNANLLKHVLEKHKALTYFHIYLSV